MPPLPRPIRPDLRPDVPLDQKIGQLLVIGLPGTHVADDSPVLHDIRAGWVGGVVLFGHNIASPDQVQALTARLQAASPVPLLISVDQEGGAVSRVSRAFGIVSNDSALDLGARNDLDATYRQNESTASVLRSLGINQNLAPVVDLNTNPANPVIGGKRRSFSADPTVVSQHAEAVIRAHHTHQILCTLKHFPGHGSSRADSHRSLADVSATWSEAELDPYRTLLNAGLADVIMTGHVFNAHLDPELPATLSAAVVSGLLREQLGYGGVVMSDDMGMSAISAYYSHGEAVERAILAGVDLVALAHRVVTADTVELIVDLVATGHIPVARIEESYRRVMRLKSTLSAGLTT